MTIKTEENKWRTAVFLSISCSVLLKTTTKQQQQRQHQKVAKTRVSAAILCPAVCINDVIIQVVMCVKSVTYVTSEPLVKSEPRRCGLKSSNTRLYVYIYVYTHTSRLSHRTRSFLHGVVGEGGGGAGGTTQSSLQTAIFPVLYVFRPAVIFVFSLASL